MADARLRLDPEHRRERVAPVGYHDQVEVVERDRRRQGGLDPPRARSRERGAPRGRGIAVEGGGGARLQVAREARGRTGHDSAALAYQRVDLLVLAAERESGGAGHAERTGDRQREGAGEEVLLVGAGREPVGALPVEEDVEPV